MNDCINSQSCAVVQALANYESSHISTVVERILLNSAHGCWNALPTVPREITSIQKIQTALIEPLNTI